MCKRKNIRILTILLAVYGLFATDVVSALAAAPCGTEHILIRQKFTSGNLAAWQMPFPHDWAIQQKGKLRYLHMKRSRPPELPRHPIQFARLKGVEVGSFTLNVDVRSIASSMAIEFNYEDPLHFYYAHFSNVSGIKDPVHNGIFIVNGGSRYRIAALHASPALPDHAWHHVRIVRNIPTGSIQVFLDRETKSRFSMIDRTFTCGQVGLGSFDETGDFTDFRLWSKDAQLSAAAK